VLQDEGTVKNDQGAVQFDRFRLTTAISPLPSRAAWAYGWWIPAMWCNLLGAQLWPSSRS